MIELEFRSRIKSPTQTPLKNLRHSRSRQRVHDGMESPRLQCSLLPWPKHQPLCGERLQAIVCRVQEAEISTCIQIQHAETYVAAAKPAAIVTKTISPNLRFRVFQFARHVHAVAVDVDQLLSEHRVVADA